MQIKSFSAPKLHEALALVRQTLGPDAVILDRTESKLVSGQSVWNVHAALDYEASPQAKQPPSHQANEAALSLEASMQRLEKIATSLSYRDTEEYRQALVGMGVRDAYDHLLSMGVSAMNAFVLAEDYAKQAPIQMPTLRWSTPINPKRKKAVLLFSGASGAGKSLLIAKLATYYSLKGVAVALLSTDSNRIGGSAVLSSYADVLGIPFSVLRSAEDVGHAQAETKSAQLVLIDSEGWNNRHASALRQQMDIWQQLACTHKILLMSASMDEVDGLAMLERANGSGFTDIAFSKLDETSKPGKIINWAEASRMPMSYCSFGPEVPAQMGWLTPKALTAILIKQYRQHLESQEQDAQAHGNLVGQALSTVKEKIA
ncbi:MAG TPA: GTP-binding protein [Ghiorsea sp.]|nr:GTP-binding protein [Ghiorsea sp.]